MAVFEININEAINPIAFEDFAEVELNSTTILNVVDNDFLGVEPTVLSIEIAPTQGTATIVSNNIEYTSNLNYIGEDRIYYRITDSNSGYSISKVTITINNLN